MITTAHVYTVLFIHLGVILVATAYYTVGAAMLPSLTARAEARFAARPVRVVLVGVAVSVPWMVVALLLLRVGGPVGLVGGLLAAAWILAGLLGGAGIAEHIGRRGDDSRSWRTTARGGLLIALTWALPIVGWIIVLPATIAAGVGCVLTGRAGRTASAATPPPPPAFASAAA